MPFQSSRELLAHQLALENGLSEANIFRESAAKANWGSIIESPLYGDL